MYPISESTLALLNKNTKQTVVITCYGIEETITITEADIIQGSLVIDRYCASGDKIEIGSAIASELALTLDNHDGRFDNYVFEGAEMYVRIGVKKQGAHKWENATTTYIPCGYFTVDKPPRKLSQINLTALDRMVVFDKEVDVGLLNFPTTVAGLINQCCDTCNVPLGTATSELVNYSYIISKAPDAENITYRQLLMWLGEITGTCAYIDWEGKLRFEWYHSTSTVITPSERYSSDLYENPVQITGVQVVDVDNNKHLYGQEGYVINVEGNPLIQSDYPGVATAVYSVVGGFEYLPYNCTIKPAPHIYPLDIIAYTDKHGNTHTTIVTNATYRMNGNTKLVGKGETTTAASYATLNPLTKRESVIIQQMKKQTDDTITNRQQAVLNLNQMVVNSLGLRQTIIPAIDGTDIYYYHNAATLADSTVIYTFREGGFAWTDNWNGGEPVWQYGFTQDGNAVFNALSAFKIQSEFIDAGAITVEKLDAEYVDGVSSSISNLDGKVSLVVSEAGGVDAVNAASIVAAINDEGSSVAIMADKIDFTGFTTFAKTDDLAMGYTTINGDCITTGEIKTELLSVNGEGFAEIPRIRAQSIGWSDFESSTGLELYSYYDIDIYSADGFINFGGVASRVNFNCPVYLYDYAEYGGYEIATLNDVPDISGLESGLQWVEFQITDPGAILDRLDDLERRVYNLEQSI